MIKTKYEIIIGLGLLAAILYIAFRVLAPATNDDPKAMTESTVESVEDYVAPEPEEHELSTILPYKSPYMGDISNIGNLFNHLPLAHLGTQFQIQAEDFAIVVYYESEPDQLTPDDLFKNLAYNSIAAFILIDNLQVIKYVISGTEYMIDRSAITSELGEDLTLLLDEHQWMQQVQDQLNESDFMGRIRSSFTVEMGLTQKR